MGSAANTLTNATNTLVSQATGAVASGSSGGINTARQARAIAPRVRGVSRGATTKLAGTA